ncbi:MAG: dTDP-glucose 4,6-dehydratase [Deltaproteobacteria bacterium]|nr:dTDP-glucose 4,6-dehydratase [Deltaproteobacteria bacterium]
MTVLVTGGAGFIGCAFVRRLLRTDPDARAVVLDALTYAGNLDNLAEALGDAPVVTPAAHAVAGLVEFALDAGAAVPLPQAPAVERERWARKLAGRPARVVPREDATAAALDLAAGPGRLAVVVGHVTDPGLTRSLVAACDAVVHFAAETHVDRSIVDADAFLRTDVHGTYVMLEAARAAKRLSRFVHVSTDEVYGPADGASFTESDAVNPCNPYSAAKTAADRLAFAYHRTHRVPVSIVRPSNNFGPFQYPEKLIPVTILKALADEPIPVYGDGRQVRDWLYVDDTAHAIDLVLRGGADGEAYNVAGRSERENLDTVGRILARLGKPASLVRHVTDRPGHDRRYSLDDSRIREDMGFTPGGRFEDRLDATVDWYVANRAWWERTLREDREYREFMELWYAGRR